MEVKWLGSEADHSPPSAEIKNVGRYTSTPSHIFMMQCLVKYSIHLHGVTGKTKDNFSSHPLFHLVFIAMECTFYCSYSLYMFP